MTGVPLFAVAKAGGLQMLEYLLAEREWPQRIDTAVGCHVLLAMLEGGGDQAAEMLVRSKIIIPALLTVRFCSGRFGCLFPDS